MRTLSPTSGRIAAMLHLILFGLLVTACNGSSTGLNQHIPHPPTPPLQRSVAVGASTVSLTTSGGTSGSVTISANPLAGQGILTSYRLASTKKFFFSVKGTDKQQAIMSFLHYTGPGTYAIQGKGTQDDIMEVTLGQQGTIWLLNPKFVGACTVVVASDTVVPGVTAEVGGSPNKVKAVDEVKGTLTCSSLSPLASGSQPLQVSQGQFDIFMDQLAS